MKNGNIKVWLPAIRVGTGTDIFTLRLAEALARRNINVEISWFPRHYEFAPSLLKRIAPPDGTDIVFANSWNGFAFKRPDLPLVVTVHHSGYDPNVHFYRSLPQHIYHHLLINQYEKRSFRAADAITAVSAYTALSVKNFTNCENIETIPNWLDTQRFLPMAKNVIGSDKPFRLLFVGKLSRLKGAEMLAAVMHRLGKGFELEIAGRAKLQGDGSYPPNVRLLGWLDEEELICAYRRCDALLFPSLSEGFGYAAVEAMACGKAVIASNTTALPEIICNNVTGILCSPGDVNAFVNACRKLDSDRQLCRKMGEAGRERAITHFSEEVILQKYMRLVHQTITTHSNKSHN